MIAWRRTSAHSSFVRGCFSTAFPFVTVVLTDSHRKSAAGSIMLAMTSWTPAIGFSGEGAGAGAGAGGGFDCAAAIVSCFGPQPLSKAPSIAAHAAIVPIRLTPILTSKSLPQIGVHGTRVSRRNCQDYVLAPR